MALYMKIPKDLNGIKEKVVFGLTKRQIFFFGIGLSLALAVYWLTYKSIGTSSAAVLVFLIGSPFFLTAMYVKDGIFTLEKIAANMIRRHLCPIIRVYKTENIYRKITEETEYKKEVEMLETGRKKVQVHESKNSGTVKVGVQGSKRDR